jgi:hypothetical protein
VRFHAQRALFRETGNGGEIENFDLEDTRRRNIFNVALNVARFPEIRGSASDKPRGRDRGVLSRLSRLAPGSSLSGHRY